MSWKRNTHRFELLGARPWWQLIIGVPLGLIAASIAGLTQVWYAFQFQGVSGWEEALIIPWPGQSVGMILQTLAAIAVMIFLAKTIARRPVYELKGTGSIQELCIGALIGAGLISLSVTILFVLGVYQVSEVVWGRGILTGLLLGIGSSFGEEVVMRGVLLRVLIGKVGAPTAIILTASAFGALHFGNPGSSFLGALGIALQAGVLFGVAFVLTRRLWLAIGMHAMWNFTQSAVFGLNVSGVPGEPGILLGELQGSEWLTGGRIGLEGSVVTISLGVLASVAILWFIKRKRNLALRSHSPSKT